MKKCFILSLVFLFGNLLPTNGDCPGISDVHTMYDQNTFTCARVYQGYGDDLEHNACNDCSGGHNYYEVYDGEDYYGNPDLWLHYGSIIVKPGCHFYGFYDYAYQKLDVIYEDPASNKGALVPYIRDGRPFGNVYDCAPYG
jgi:hypothetical protein